MKIGKLLKGALDTVIDVNDKLNSAQTVIAQTVSEYGTKAAKVVSGYQAYQDRKKANIAKEEADKIFESTTRKAEQLREEASKNINEFGLYRCQSLKNTVGRFIDLVKYMDKSVNTKEYTIFRDVELTENEIKQLESIEMNASQALGTAAISGGVAAAALTGVPTAVTATVSALATASTGTAISSLSGAAATNATLAWLGGGSLAAGGGGIAAGTTVLAGITYASTGILALASAGIVASTYYSKKYTEATKHLEEIKVWKAKVDASCVVMRSIIRRCNELEEVTRELEKRTTQLLDYLEPLVYDFDTNEEYQLQTFQETAMLIKSMSDLAQVPLMDSDGNLTQESGVALTKAQKLLSNNL